MKIKRFVDRDMRRALRQVRNEQGADAVILSNRRVPEGIEVIAAVDYDAALMQHALGREATAATATTQPPAAQPAPTPSRLPPTRSAARPAPAKAPVVDLPSGAFATDLDLDLTPFAIADPSLATMRADIASLRGLLETQVSGLLWADGSRRSPQLSQVLRNLARLGIAPDIAREIVARLGPVEALKGTWQQPLAVLSQMVPVAGSRLMTDGGVAALVGPTGVGKTTTIAKLAARFAMHHGSDNIALVCADAWRIGAREHLMAFASILGVTVHAASDPAELNRILRSLQTKKLVLVDTEGLSQRDADLAARLAGWRSAGDDVKFWLTVSACSQEAALDETIRSFRHLPLAGAIVTKVDEAGQLGCVLSALIRQELPLGWVADGQHIPDDLHAAEGRKLWLLKRAVDCLAASQPQVDEHTMAEHYGMVTAPCTT